MKHRREIESINDKMYVNAQGVVIELNEKLLKISMYMNFPSVADYIIAYAFHS